MSLYNYIKLKGTSGTYGYVDGYIRNSFRPFDANYFRTTAVMPEDLLTNQYFYEHDYVNGEWVFVLSAIPREPPTVNSVWVSGSSDWSDGRTLQQKKDDKWAEFQILMQADATADVTYNTNVYAADFITQTRLMMVQSYAAIDPLVTQEWETVDAVAVSLTSDDFLAIMNLIAEQDLAARAKGRIKKSDIAAATDETALDAITW